VIVTRVRVCSFSSCSKKPSQTVHVKVRAVKKITTMEDRLQLVTQLTRASYTRWKFEMMALLESKSVEDLIDGTRTEPAETADETTKATWRKNNALAKSLILKTLDEDHFKVISTCTTARDMWTRLTALYEDVSATTKLLVNEDFHGYCWLEGMNVSTYIAGLAEVVQRLRSLGETVSRETVIGKIVRGLPEQFNSFREVW